MALSPTLSRFWLFAFSERGISLPKSLRALSPRVLLSLFRENGSTKSLLVISSYPGQGEVHGAGVGGIAAFAKNTLVSLKKASPRLSITVLAERLEDKISAEDITSRHIKQGYTDQKITVKRVWRRNSIFTFSNILKEIYKNHKKTDKVLMEFGFSIYGDMRYLLPLPVFLLVLKLMRKKTYFVFHEIVPDINEVSGHTNIEEESIRATLFNIALWFFYNITLRLVTKSIVLEDVLREKLRKFGNGKKISVIPIGVQNFSTKISKRQSRIKLNIPQKKFVLLCFGFIAWYKGTDWIINEIEKIRKTKKLGSEIELILAGGENKDKLNKEFYRNYLYTVKRKCSENSITLTGFIQEKEIELYFQAADLIIFPYRVLMGASAPLTLAYSFRKPFLVSEAMRGIFKAQDIENTLKNLRLKKEKLYFGQNGDFVKKLFAIKKDPILNKKTTSLAKSLARSRSWENVGVQYYEEIFT